MDFNIVRNTEEAVLIEVVFEDAIDQMSQKGFTGKEKYIKYTKGKNHKITLYDKDHNAYFSFDFGDSGTTVVSDDTNHLKSMVYRYLLKERIQPRKMTSERETELKIMPAKDGLGVKDHYCVHLGGEFAIFLPNEEEISELFGEYEVYNKEKAVTGVTVIHAKLTEPKKYYEICFYGEGHEKDWTYYIKSNERLTYKSVKQKLEDEFLGVDGLEEHHLKNIHFVNNISAEEFENGCGIDA